MLNSDLHNEEYLLLQLSQGDEVAFEATYRKYSPALYGKLVKILKSSLVAEDILQEVFIIVWNNREKIDAAKCFRSYITCIAVNKCYDYFRKVARANKLHCKLMLAKSEYLTTDQVLIIKEESEIVFQTIELLPPKRKLIFRLCKMDGKSYEEISKQLGISISTISDHMVKANAFMRSRLSHSVF